ncbi:MAG: hypothetical protein GY874_19530 [Desulfobacteraceae bacterium]|nr:hypothetical protein [Desulfobacteraceae bacterium]
MNKIGRHFVSLLIIGFLCLLGVGSSESENSQNSVKTPEEKRLEQIKNGFSAWDGSHQDLTKLIKQSMNDPDSYKHEKTVYWDMKDHLIVKTTFRGKNAFGGVVKNWVKAKCDLDGYVIAVLEQGS